MTKAERTKQSIIETAAVLFNEKGIAGTSIDEVLQASKVAKGCLYGHFQSKDELAYACVDYLLLKQAGRRTNAMAQQATAVDKLRVFIELNPDPVNGSYIPGGCPILNFGVDADDTNEAIRERVKTAVVNLMKTLTAIVKEGVKAGEISAEVNPEEFATKILTMVEGATMMSRVMGTPMPMKTAIRAMKKELAEYSLV